MVFDTALFSLTGDAESIRSSGGSWSTFSKASSTAAGDIRCIDSGDFQGDEADTYRDKLNQDLPPHLDTTSDAWAAVAAALQTYATALAGLQTRMTTLSAQAGDQQSQVDTAHNAVADATTADARHTAAVTAETKALRPGQALPPDTYRPQTTDASVQLVTANAALQSSIVAAKQLRADHNAALDACVGTINQAAGMRFEEPPGFWGRLTNSFVGWVQDNANVLKSISSALKQISGIAGMLAMIPVLAPIMGPIAVATGAGALAIDTTIKVATGEGSWTDIAMDGLSVIPGGRAATGVGKGALAGEDAVKTVSVVAKDAHGVQGVSPEVRSADTSTSGITRVDGVGSGVGSDVTGADTVESRAVHSSRTAADHRTPPENRVCAGDPIDVVTGQMVMQQTDLALPGVLPLILQRVHLSSYRWGRLFGPSWASTLDQRVEVGSDGGACFVAADGVVLYYPDANLVAPGTAVLPTQGRRRWPIRRSVDGGWTVEDPDAGIVRRFAAAAGDSCVIAEMSDRRGNSLCFEYDSHGAVCRVSHSGGYLVDVTTVDGAVTGLVVHDQDAETLVTSFGYDSHGNLVRVNNSAGDPLTLDYDGSHRIVGWTDRNSIFYRYEYDENGHCVRTSGRGRVLSYGFCYLPGRTLVTDSLGAVSVYEFNTARQVIRHIDPLGHVTASVWDRHDRLLLRTDALGRSTRFERDEWGRLIAVEHPDGAREVLQRNRQGQPIRTVDAAGAVWLRTYDSSGDLLSIVDPLGHRTFCTRAATGAIATATDPVGAVTTVVSNGAGRPVEVIDAARGRTAVAYDGFGRPTLLTDAVGGLTTVGWTAEGKLSHQISPDGARREWTWDGEGNLLEYIDGAGARTVVENGVFDLPVARTGPDGGRFEFAYDTELRLTAVLNPAGLRWTYCYDPAGRLVAETDFNGRTQTYRHDGIGRLIGMVNGLGQETHLRYDISGDLVERVSADGATTYSFDQMGRLLSANSPSAVAHLDRDELGRVVRETVNGRSVISAFDAAGRRSSRLTPAGVLSEWSFDAAGRPALLTTGDQGVIFEFDPAGRETGRAFSSGARLDRTFDSADRLVRQITGSVIGAPDQTSVAGVAPVTSRSYAYRIDGALECISDGLSGSSRRFDLDTAGRVVGVRASGWTESYAYDQAGNLSMASSTTSSATVWDGTGRRSYAGTLVKAAGDISYRHDRQGRVVTRSRRRLSRKPETWKYRYDDQDQLVSASSGDQRWIYRYDPFGRRISKQRSDSSGGVAELTLFTWDGDRLIEQATTSRTDMSAVATWEYLPGGWAPISQTMGGSADGAQFYAIVTDVIGAPTELISADGKQVAWRNADSTVWGAPSGTASTFAENRSTKYEVDCPIRFPGQYADTETGLHYNRHRYYDPTAARYTTADPLGLAPADDPYSYVHNPTTWCDPLGLVPCGEVNLASKERTTHILDGEIRDDGSYGGGHRSGTGYPGKSEFPASWSDGQVMHHISDVATDPAAIRTALSRRKVMLKGTRDGIDIEVLVRRDEIWTGYPTNVPRNR